jgi:hypothetical protein
MDRVQRAFDVLNVVASDGVPGHLARAVGPHQRLVVRQQRFAIRRAHVGEDEAAKVLARVRRVPNAIFEGGVRLGWLLDAVAVHVIDPAMHGAPDAAILDPPVLERDQAV